MLITASRRSWCCAAAIHRDEIGDWWCITCAKPTDTQGLRRAPVLFEEPVQVPSTWDSKVWRINQVDPSDYDPNPDGPKGTVLIGFQKEEQARQLLTYEPGLNSVGLADAMGVSKRSAQRYARRVKNAGA